MTVTQAAASSSPPPPPPSSAAVYGRVVAMEKEAVSAPARPRPMPGGDILGFTNGATLKRHNPQPPASPPGTYRECLKNHAALLGGHALDGCGEFMPSPLAVPSDPSSLKCAACGCHRNFHRRDDDPAADAAPDPDPDPAPAAAGELTPKSSASPPRQPPPPISSPYFSSAPHMLLALSTGAAGPGPGPAHSAAPIGRKRFRTKFSREQKERMLLFAEKLGWRFQKQEEKLVEEFCNEIGVAKGVLKVWMHNNKHTFVKKDHQSHLFHGSNGNGGFNNESSNGFNTNGTTAAAAHVFHGSSSSS